MDLCNNSYFKYMKILKMNFLKFKHQKFEIENCNTKNFKQNFQIKIGEVEWNF